ncbi:hypothetical protein CHH27_20425 [Labrenzia sp. VG12]|nr:hypothetical protein CHH27_20425 [Labrenzia sp. VG12]
MVEPWDDVDRCWFFWANEAKRDTVPGNGLMLTAKNSMSPRANGERSGSRPSLPNQGFEHYLSLVIPGAAQRRPGTQ